MEEGKDFVFIEQVTFRSRIHGQNSSRDLPHQKKLIELIDRYTPERKHKNFKGKLMSSYTRKLFRNRKFYQVKNSFLRIFSSFQKKFNI